MAAAAASGRAAGVGSSEGRHSHGTPRANLERQAAGPRAGAVRRAEEPHPHVGHLRARPAALQHRDRPDELRDRVTADIRRLLNDEAGIAREDRERLTSEILDDILGYGPLERLIADDSITEIMCNGPDDIWIERGGKLYETTVRFTDESHLRRIINKIVSQIGRRIDESSPMVDARLRREPRERDHPRCRSPARS